MPNCPYASITTGFLSSDKVSCCSDSHPQYNKQYKRAFDVSAAFCRDKFIQCPFYKNNNSSNTENIKNNKCPTCGKLL